MKYSVECPINPNCEEIYPDRTCSGRCLKQLYKEIIAIEGSKYRSKTNDSKSEDKPELVETGYQTV